MFVYMTAKDKAEARDIGAFLVESRLAACVNILEPMHSIYVWQDEVQEDVEAVLIAKTTAERAQALIDAVKERHSYDCPCIVILPISGGNPEYLQWVLEQVNSYV
jgi:periplasmic divalent cation tolerance protein